MADLPGASGGPSRGPPSRIRKLDPDVVNKIAAGEIIVAPVNALKELIENAVDAGSTSLEIQVKEGGLKFLQLQDNGCGIDKDDLPILCERFTTSKLKSFEDLSTIATYGFRGEALASISHIAHLKVTTQTATSPLSWTAHYESGKLIPAKPGGPAQPTPGAGTKGTRITVEDLFYNIPMRRKAFRSPADEYNKIIDMVSKYSVHCSNVSFSCKKAGESKFSVSIPANATPIDRIRQIYGAGVANEIIEFETSDDRWGFKAKGIVTNANYYLKRTNLLLFVNHRSVDSTNVKRGVEQTYATFLPKGGRPFVYLSLDIDPRRVDVNVHPTKREVNFLNEDEIIQAICETIRSKLAEVDTSRTFYTQTVIMPGMTYDLQQADAGGSSSAGATPSRTPGSKSLVIKTSMSAKKTPSRNDSALIRTDASSRKITSFMPTIPGGSGPSSGDLTLSSPPVYEDSGREPVLCRLSSVRQLRAEVRDDMHQELTEVMANHTFVGIVDESRRLAAIQSGTKLFLVDYGRLCYEYFYQVGLTDFANFGSINFAPPLNLRALLRAAAEMEKQNGCNGAFADDDSFDVDEIVENVFAQFIERREMLLEYFSLEFTPSGELVSIPLLVKNYTPSFAKLPQFLLRLGPHVDWMQERECFETFLRELATYYVPEKLPCEGEEEDPNAADDPDEKRARQDIIARRQHVRHALEHVLFPAFKAKLVATRGLMNGSVLELSNLQGLYRVFERC